MLVPGVALTASALCSLKETAALVSKKEVQKIIDSKKTQVPLPLVKDTGGMAKLSIVCSIVFSDGCTLCSVNKTLIDTTWCQLDTF